MAKILLTCLLMFCVNLFSQNIEITYKASVKHIDTIQNEKNSQIIKRITNGVNRILPSIEFVVVSDNEYYNVKYQQMMISDYENESYLNLAVTIALDGNFIIGDLESSKSYYESGQTNKIKKVRMDNITWSLSKETKTILGYVCYKALAETIDLNEDNKLNPPRVAWFAPDLNFRGGPTAYANLPGIILEMETPKTIFKAISVKNKKKVDLKRPNYNQENVLSHKELEQYFIDNSPISGSRN
ncbi:GLPGLI family protein [Zunongwangia atlantica]|nr:GLPGLI family protein [Zunongwangia atlantica]